MTDENIVSLDLPDFMAEASAPDDSLKCDLCDFVGKTMRGKRQHMTKTHGSGDRAPRGTGKRSPQLERKLQEFFGAIGSAVFFFDQHCGAVLLEGSERMAHALTNLANQYPTVRRTLESMTQAGAIGEVVIAGATVAMPIMAHHGLLPQNISILLAPRGSKNGASAESSADTSA